MVWKMNSEGWKSMYFFYGLNLEIEIPDAYWRNQNQFKLKKNVSTAALMLCFYLTIIQASKLEQTSIILVQDVSREVRYRIIWITLSARGRL